MVTLSISRRLLAVSMQLATLSLENKTIYALIIILGMFCKRVICPSPYQISEFGYYLLIRLNILC